MHPHRDKSNIRVSTTLSFYTPEREFYIEVTKEAYVTSVDHSHRIAFRPYDNGDVLTTFTLNKIAATKMVRALGNFSLKDAFDAVCALA